MVPWGEPRKHLYSKKKRYEAALEESVQDASQGATVADEGSKVDAEGYVARDKGMAGT